MRKSIITATTALALSVAFAGTAQADTNVQSLTGGDWSASNSTVAKTADGVHFGTYANGGAIGGSLMYKGANGLPLKDVTDLSYKFNYRQAGNTTGAAPYARIFLDSNNDGVTDTDVILDPSEGGLVTPLQSTDLTFGTGDGSVRYGDDAGASAQQTWADVKALHGDDKITNVLVSQGNSMGTDVSAMVKQITFNGERFNFDTPPADGATGPQGPQGYNGNNGVNGTDGKNGTNGANGAAGTNGVNGVTTIIHDYGTLVGNTVRTISAPSIKGMKFVSVRASLRGERLPVHGRKITVDLRGKTVGRYNVSMTAKYKNGGKTYVVRSIRSLSVTR